MFFTSFFFVVVFIFLQPVNAGIHIRKENGHNAKPHQFPWTLSIETAMYPSYSKPGCGATLLRVFDDVNESDMVLTAGHCIGRVYHSLALKKLIAEYRVKGSLTVVAGKHTTFSSIDDPTPQDNETRHEIADMIYHPKFPTHDEMMDDLALIKLASPIVFNDIVKPAVLPTSDETVKDGDACVETGWGYVEGNERPEVLRYANITIKTCSKIDGYDEKRDFCGLKNSQNSGDSGGPVVCSWRNGEPVLTGIVASINVDLLGSAKSEDMYLRVNHYLEWIKEQIAKMTAVKKTNK